MKKLFWFILALSMIAVSCHKDSDNDTEDTSTTEGVVIEQGKEGLIFGLVTDLDGNPISGARVQGYAKSTTTDEQGVFSIENATLSPGGIYVKATADGYHLGSDMVYTKEGKDAYVRIAMIPLQNGSSFQSSVGGSIDIVGGGQVVFDKDAIALDGNPYNGNVTVYAQRIAANDTQLADMMPGGLYGIDEKGRNVVLGTAGMVAVELRSDDNKELQLREGAKALVSFPIIEVQQDIASAEIDLWSFDENKGLWIHEGKAKKKGNNYEAEVTHFSFWNCDAPFPVVAISGQLLEQTTNKPLKYAVLEIETSGYGVAYGYTNQDGYFSGKIPKDMDMTLRIKNIYCNTYLYEEAIGPFSTDVNLGVIEVSNGPNQISGSLNCNGTNVSGYVMIKLNSIHSVVNTEEDGSFTAPIYPCTDNFSFDIRGVDPATGKASPWQTYTQDQINDLSIGLCSANCDLTLDITNNQADVCKYEDIKVKAEVSGGSGNYSYLWNNGETTQEVFPDTLSGELCVEVTDNEVANCVQNFCKEIDLNILGPNIAYNTNFDCDNDTGNMILTINAKNPPYSISILNTSLPAQTVTETGQQELTFGPLPSGQYQVEITDGKGCTYIQYMTLQNFDIPLEINSNRGYICEGGLELEAAVRNSGDQFTYEWSTGETSPTIVVTASGEYCVTATNNGCSVRSCIYVQTAEEAFGNTFYCNSGSYLLETNQQVSYGNNTYNDLINPNNPNQVIATVTIDPSCSYTVERTLNDVALSDFVVNNTTCDGCNDGYVTWTNNSALIDCEDCAFNDVQIYSIDDLSTNLFDTNEAKQLAAGNYVFVGTNKYEEDNYGCVILRKTFTIE